jgi:hypothetical protein
LFEIAQRVRAVLEQSVWPEVINTFPSERFIFPPGSGVKPSSGMCWISSHCAIDLLSAEFPDGQWKLAGGHPVQGYEHLFERIAFKAEFDGEDGGLLAPSGVWCGHDWVEGSFEGKTVIVDLTGDQFGLPSVNITSSVDVRYRANYSDRKLSAGIEDDRVTKLKGLAADAWHAMNEAKRRCL